MVFWRPLKTLETEDWLMFNERAIWFWVSPFSPRRRLKILFRFMFSIGDTLFRSEFIVKTKIQLELYRL